MNRLFIGLVMGLCAVVAQVSLANAQATLNLTVTDSADRRIEGIEVRVIKTNDKSLVGTTYTNSAGKITQQVFGSDKKIDVLVGVTTPTHNPATHSCPPSSSYYYGYNYTIGTLCGKKSSEYATPLTIKMPAARTPTETVCRLTGVDSVTWDPLPPNTQPTWFHYWGHDGPMTVPIHQDTETKLLWGFGDTKLDPAAVNPPPPYVPPFTGAPTNVMPNTLATSVFTGTEGNPAQCLVLTYQDLNKAALPLTAGPVVNEIGAWFGAPLVVHGNPSHDPSDPTFYEDDVPPDTLHVFYYSVIPGTPFLVDYIGVATWDHAYTGPNTGICGAQFCRELAPRWEQPEEAGRTPGGATILENGVYTMLAVGGLDCSSGRCLREVTASQVDAEDILDKNAYRYWDATANGGLGAFSSAPNRDPDPVLLTDPAFLSDSVNVMWSTYLQRWIMVGMQYTEGPAAYLWSADDLTGPWDGPAAIMENLNAQWSYIPTFLPDYTAASPNDKKVYWTTSYQTFNPPGVNGPGCVPGEHPTCSTKMNYNVFLHETDLTKVKLYCGDGVTNGSCTTGNVGAVCTMNAQCNLGQVAGTCLVEGCDDGNKCRRDGCSDICEFEGKCALANQGCATNADCPYSTQCNCAPATPCAPLEPPQCGACGGC